MTKQKRENYRSVEDLRGVFKSLKGEKFTLDCGHHVTFGHFLGNNLVLLNGKEPKIICTECGY
jgi:hypothetical protein